MTPAPTAGWFDTFGTHLLRTSDPDAAAGALDLDDLDPGVWGATAARRCSVCDEPIGPSGPLQVWISRVVATDVLPLLVNACSQDCVEALPPAAEGHVAGPHKGGPDIVQPTTRF